MFAEPRGAVLFGARSGGHMPRDMVKLHKRKNTLKMTQTRKKLFEKKKVAKKSEVLNAKFSVMEKNALKNSKFFDLFF